MTGDIASPATTVSGWLALPEYVRLAGYVTANGQYNNVTPPQPFKRSTLASIALDRRYSGMIVKSKGLYYISKPDNTFMSFTRKSAALAALRMMNG